MKIGSSRMAWHDAFYMPWDSVMCHGLELAKLGRWVQTTKRDSNLGRMAHQVLAGLVQNAIASLPGPLQLFGHHLYAPVVDTPLSNFWEESAVELVEAAFLLRMDSEKQGLSAEKRAVLPYVVRGVLVRYRHMVQGGMGRNLDPMAAAHVFRAWLFDNHGITLDRRNWTREWGWIIQRIFREADMLDARALQPVARVLDGERETPVEGEIKYA